VWELSVQGWGGLCRVLVLTEDTDGVAAQGGEMRLRAATRSEAQRSGCVYFMNKEGSGAVQQSPVSVQKSQ